MKFFIALLGVAIFAGTAIADQYVNGYTRKDGTYVDGYHRSSPNSSYNDNYSVKGNSNPYNGESGTNSRTYNDRTPDYNTKTYGNPGYENSLGGSSSGRKSKSIFGY